MRGWLLSTILVLNAILTFALSGCATPTCERLCQWLGEIDDEEEHERRADCEATCEDDYGQAGNYCRDRLHDLSQCVANVLPGEEQTLAEASWLDCDDELTLAIDSCGCNRSECTGRCTEDNGIVRTVSPTCGAITSTEP